MRNIQIKARFIGISLVGSMALSWVASSFEHRYFCTIDLNSITVSIETGAEYCYTYVEDVHVSLQHLYEDISRADDHIKEREDLTYRTKVKSDLEVKQVKLLDLQEKLVAAIDDYEADLFLRVKTILLVYLRGNLAELTSQYSQTNNFLIQVKKMGDRGKYRELLVQQEELFTRLRYLEAIRDASNFVELLGPLRDYIKLLNQDKESTT